MKAEMTAADVVQIVQLLVENGITVHVDGGWGIDALLEKQIRPHADLDIAVRHSDLPRLRELLEARGYEEIPHSDSWACNFVLADDTGREVDVHAYERAGAGNHVFGVPYPADSLTDVGVINGYRVDCISPTWIVKFHTGYELDIDDYRDVSAICDRFGIPLPTEYTKFRKADL